MQDNHSRSRHGIVRGMHFQVGAGMAKLVRCGRGAIVDVVVDLRRGSPTFGRVGVLRAERREPAPAATARSASRTGSASISELADVLYKCSAYYDESIERGIRYDDPDVGIQWPRRRADPVGARRQRAPPREIEDELPFTTG